LGLATQWRGNQNARRLPNGFCHQPDQPGIPDLFRKAGLDLAPGIHHKNTTPEDIWRATLPHRTYLLERETARSGIEKLGQRVTRRVKARVRLLKRRVGAG
jgi:hypothetical protein